ncbi:MAG: bifunctional phosphoribosylaminoimidazolecarboxamide formyltransferase/IMP cyclohydrolase, partial [Acidobacteria bacterium]|nr:bifunctional phosphoribosylaminoimidazolecarboxamide formyltransferase/IMP cyclohydrolase [Acidobacteriota bacterium]
MIETNLEGARRVQRALLSVSDKTGIVEFARALKRFDVEIISTGGTASTLREAGIEVRDISDVTGFPEMMDGRVKTLHPRIHGGLLALRENPGHLAAMREHGIEPIDMVVVNLYPFEQTVARHGVTLEEAIEQIDIGGPSMIRSAAKNFRDVAIVSSPVFYKQISDELARLNGALSFQTREQLAHYAFLLTSGYDDAIFRYLNERLAFKYNDAIDELIEREASGREKENAWPSFEKFALKKVSDLRYGENPHQSAALYSMGVREGVAQAKVLSGKEMSYNNYVDAEAAWQLVCDFDELTCAIIKHTNPAGVGAGASVEEAYRRALATDPLSAFGGIVAFNRKVDE